jgi:hypothetical protein
VGPGELPESRQVSVNAGRITAGPQFGLRMTNEDAPGAVGQTVGTLGKRFDPKPSSPKGFPKVTISLAAIGADYEGVARVCKGENRKMPFTLAEAIASTVAHEIAHGLGVAHHGGASYGSSYAQVTPEMRAWKVYDRDGRELVDRPFAINGGVGNVGSDASGDVNCIMCYNNIYNWCYQDGVRSFFGAPFVAQGSILCTLGKGTGPNAPRAAPGGGQLPGVFGDATKGACLAQVRVKDQ